MGSHLIPLPVRFILGVDMLVICLIVKLDGLSTGTDIMPFIVGIGVDGTVHPTGAIFTGVDIDRDSSCGQGAETEEERDLKTHGQEN